jgi:hypothetical protein
VKLHEITEQFRELQTLADSEDADFAIAVRDTLHGIEAEFQEKAKAVAAVALNFDASITAIDTELARLQERKLAISNRQEKFKSYIRENMEACGISKISCPLFTITLAQGRESVVIDNEDAIPDELMSVKTEIKPDKKAIAERIKAGDQIEGAHLERGKSSIRIK